MERCERMGVLAGLKPERVFYYFEEITKIPHGSGNVRQISDYLKAFAQRNGLFCIQDELSNIIIVKEATPGYENEPPLIFQGHMDMVAVKKPDCAINLRTEGLKVAVRGDEIYAEGTSLGGDDGIAVAYSLALLESGEISHPKLEVVITVDEEVGMDGARGIDLSMLTGHRMLNLDSEDEGVFLSSCAGGARVLCRVPAEREKAAGMIFEVKIGGLLGGHSGEEINKERGNSNCIFGRWLYQVSRQMKVRLVEARGGLADNAIPRETVAKVMIASDDRELLHEVTVELENKIKEELQVKDPGFFLQVTEMREEELQVITVADTGKIASFLWSLPDGVQAMSADMPGLVETSLNLGILNCNDTVVKAEFSVRSSVESGKEALISRLEAITTLAGGTITVTGDYPGWKYRSDSPLREKMIRLYREMYQREPVVRAIHAGLECGILAGKIKDLDCVSIGPQMKDIHTTEETLSISSTARLWEFIVKLLETKEE